MELFNIAVLKFTSCPVILSHLLNDPKDIVGSFMDECEEYLIKPITAKKLLEKIREMGLIK